MKEAGINSATVGIFTRSLIEPEEGVYNFSFLDTMLRKKATQRAGTAATRKFIAFS